GPHHLTLVRSGKTSAERSVTVSAGERARFELMDAPQPTNGRRVASMVAFSVAGVSLLGLGAFALLRADRLAKIEAACPNLTGCDRSLESVVRDGKTYSAAINVFAGLAAAASVTGTVLYATSLSSSTPRSAARVDLRMHPVVGPGIGFVVLEANF
ncbi:MAG TPA: hypothetical protein PK156_49955, partial [Polyangium sp.]|nr:hypothetical protein [Polyangium sp.]